MNILPSSHRTQWIWPVQSKNIYKRSTEYMRTGHPHGWVRNRPWDLPPHRRHKGCNCYPWSCEATPTKWHTHHFTAPSKNGSDVQNFLKEAMGELSRAAGNSSVVMHQAGNNDNNQIIIEAEWSHYQSWKYNSLVLRTTLYYACLQLVSKLRPPSAQQSSQQEDRYKKSEMNKAEKAHMLLLVV